jgi:plasmid stability protein
MDAFRARKAMKQVLIRNLPDDVLERLQARARQRGQSLEAMLRSLLTEMARGEREGLKRRADEIAEMLADRSHSDSSELIRQQREP